MKHQFIITLHANASKSEAAAYIRDAVRTMGGCHNPDESPFFGLKSKAVSVRPAKPWSGDAKPAKVTIRRLKSGFWAIYVSGRGLIGGLGSLKVARQYLRNRHPALLNSVTVRR